MFIYLFATVFLRTTGSLNANSSTGKKEKKKGDRMGLPVEWHVFEFEYKKGALAVWVGNM